MEMSEFEKFFVPEEWKKTMTNHQFDYLIKLEKRLTLLEQQNATLYETVQAKVEAGASPEEILKVIADLTNGK